MKNMFDGASIFNGNISAWNVSKLFDMNGMFRNAYAFNQFIRSWNVYNVIYMQSMFENTVSFDQNISRWDVSNVDDENLYSMFNGANAMLARYPQLKTNTSANTPSEEVAGIREWFNQTDVIYRSSV